MDLEMNPRTRKILHLVSVSGVFLALFGVLSLLQMFTVGIILNINNVNYNGFYPLPILYSLCSIFIIMRFFHISSPYK